MHGIWIGMGMGWGVSDAQPLGGVEIPFEIGALFTAVTRSTVFSKVSELQAHSQISQTLQQPAKEET